MPRKHQARVATTFPVAGAPCRFCASDCRNPCSVALLPDPPSAAIRLLKLCCKASSEGFDVLDPDDDESDADESDVAESCWLRLARPLSSFPMPPPP